MITSKRHPTRSDRQAVPSKEMGVLKISEQVAAALRHRSIGTFHADVAQMLTDQFPEYAADRSAVGAAVDVAIHDGAELGLQSERALAMYALLVFLMGIDIKDDERLRNMLLAGGLSEAGKADAMGQWLTDIAKTLEGA